MNSSLVSEADLAFMRMALYEASLAAEAGEIPVGALITNQGKIIARAHNLCEQLTDVTAHAEMLAITSAASFLGGKYLKNCTLYVTTEPCPMCAGALYWSQIERLVFGCPDEKRGFSTLNSALLHPKTIVTRGVLQTECANLMKDFFKNLR
jgi:tRNA(adenine34) deaminase